MKKNEQKKALERWLSIRASKVGAEVLHPLPTTRELGSRFGVSHATAFRILLEMEKAGLVWRRQNGRYHPARAARILDRPKPVAVMLRKMDAWSALCREVMEGFTDQCGALDRGILLIHNPNLLNQSAPNESFNIQDPVSQSQVLQDFQLLHGGNVGGTLYDEVWSDLALKNFVKRTTPATIFYRTSSLKNIGCVAADFAGGARLAMEHLLECGYQQIYILAPFANYDPLKVFLNAAPLSYQGLTGKKLPTDRIIHLSQPGAEANFLGLLGRETERCGIICPEDNTAEAFFQTLSRHGFKLGRKHGLISVMGTDVARKASLTSVGYDFRQMGALLASQLCQNRPSHAQLPPKLILGRTTSKLA